MRDQPYPANFWKHVPGVAIDRIFSGKSGNERVTALFRELQGTAVSRATIDDVAQQKDFTRRLRADGGGGTRDQLLQEGIVVLSKTYHKSLMADLSLPLADFVSFKPSNAQEAASLKAAGFDV